MILIAKIHRPQDKKSSHIRNNRNLITINDGINNVHNIPSKVLKDFDPLESL